MLFLNHFLKVVIVGARIALMGRLKLVVLGNDPYLTSRVSETLFGCLIMHNVRSVIATLPEE